MATKKTDFATVDITVELNDVGEYRVKSTHDSWDDFDDYGDDNRLHGVVARYELRLKLRKPPESGNVIEIPGEFG
jgi:hypothetical protein